MDRGESVKIVVRSTDSLSENVINHPNLSVIEASILDLSDAALTQYALGCKAVASCLGHTLSLEGLFGSPHKLVTDATRRLCAAVKANEPTEPVKFVLMNTTGNRNRDLDEPISFGQKCVIGLLRVLLPPHSDNEHAADYLRKKIGQNDGMIEWTAVRPDSLTNEATLTEYEIHPSPTRSAIFNAGKTSRINVAHFMADLITESEVWNQWNGQMPVIYNKTDS